MTIIRTPDHRLRVFVSSTLQELADERVAAREAIVRLHQTPVLFELGARPHPPRDLYRAYLEQSHIFIGIYWERYGWVAPTMDISGLEDEYRLSGNRPKLIYIKHPAPKREPKLDALLDDIRDEGAASYQRFSTPEELRELIANDLALMLTERFEATQPVNAPTPTAAPEARHNPLPVPRTPLIGREREVDAACEILLRDDCCLLTLTGPGGTGKTRMALHIADSLQDRFSDGVFFVRLATLINASQVVPAIAQVLGIRETGDWPLLETLKENLRNKQMLLVLDNFEQVIDAAPQVAELFNACPTLKILVTSRTPLHVQGERELLVLPLALPNPQHHASPEGLSQFAAVELFMQRAQAVKPDFVLTAENAAIVAEICQRLDGLPLALELAAAHLKFLSPQALLTRLERGLSKLGGGARDLPDRQQTLRNTIDWSYNLLDTQAKALLRRSTIFTGSWTLESAEAICNVDGDLGDDLIDELAALVDQSLLRRVNEDADETRFGMLSTIRAYAHEQLLASGEEARLQQRHADYLIGLAEEAEPYFIDARRTAWLDHLEADLDDVRAALQWSTTTAGEGERAVRLAGALSWFWYLRSYLHEGRAWLEKALAHATSAGAAYRARAHYGAGALAWAQGDHVIARTHLEESRQLFAAAKQEQAMASSITYLGAVALALGEPACAQDFCTQGVTLLRNLGNRWGEGFALYWLGEATLALGDTQLAHTHYNQSLDLYRAIGDPWGTSIPLHALAGQAWKSGDYTKAQALFQESGALAREVGDKWSYARSLTGSAAMALHQGNNDQAKLLFAVTLSLWRELGNRTGISRCLIGLAGVASAEGQPERAARLLGAAETVRRIPFLATNDAQPGALFMLEAVDQDEFGRTLTAVRAQLDATAVAQAWQTGQALTLERAINFALDDGQI